MVKFSITFDRPKEKRQRKVWKNQKECEALVGRYFMKPGNVGRVTKVLHERGYDYAKVAFEDVRTYEGKLYNTHLYAILSPRDLLTEYTEVTKQAYDDARSIVAKACEELLALNINDYTKTQSNE